LTDGGDGLSGYRHSLYSKAKMGWSKGLSKKTHSGISRMANQLKGRTKETHPGIKNQSEKIKGRTKENHSGIFADGK